MIYTDKVFVNTAKTVFAYFVVHVSTAFISGKMSYWGYKLGIWILSFIAMLLFLSDYAETWCKKNEAPKEDEAEINRKITGCIGYARRKIKHSLM